MAKIFLTGASGYIGGDLLHLIAKLHPQYQVRALVRDGAKDQAIKKCFGQVQVVKGGLDDVDLIAEEARQADVVLHLAATGHLKSVQTIHQALMSKPTGQKPPYWIQISGGSLLAAPELANKSWTPGTSSDITYNDISGIGEIQALIKRYPSRAVDNYMLSIAGTESHLKIAVVVPPIIYGQGRGPGNKRSIQIPELAKVTLQRQKGLQVGLGLNRWGNIHIQDLSQLLLRLVERAVEDIRDDKIWGRNGLYLAGVGELTFGDISRRVAAAAHNQGLLPSINVDQINGEEANNLLPHGTVLYGTNARGQGHRAKALLDWTPQEHSLEEDIARVVAEEAHSLGLYQEKSRIFKL